jgi:hypothetical protein
MPEDPQLRGALDAIRSRLQAELEAQLGGIVQHHEDALAAARRDAETEAEQRWTLKLDSLRAEWGSRLESEMAAARAEAERRMVAESMRLRAEAERAAAESAAQVRAEIEAGFALERQRAAAELDAEKQRVAEMLAERQRLNEEVEAERQRADREIETGRQRTQVESESAVTQGRAEERQSQLAAVERLMAAVDAISAARSLSEVLKSLVDAASREASRVALFVVDGSQLRTFAHQGFEPSRPVPDRLAAPEGVLSEALRAREAISTASDLGQGTPAFASLPPDRAAIAVPIVLDGQPVALLYADDGARPQPEAPAPWPETVRILGRHAAAWLAFVTTARAAQAIGRAARSGRVATDAEHGARRYARLLVSEIKLYNEPAVRVGRQKHDLLDRLRPEIERARRLYEERVPPAVGARAAYFQQELVQTLADGDPALLGG